MVRSNRRWQARPIGGGDLQAAPQVLGIADLGPHRADHRLECEHANSIGQADRGRQRGAVGEGHLDLSGDGRTTTGFGETWHLGRDDRPDGDGVAGARSIGRDQQIDSGDLVVRNSVFERNENGILSAHNAGASVTIRDSEFIANGYGDGRTHGIYVNKVASLLVEDSTFRDTKVGHHIKSRAAETTVLGSMLDDGAGNASYSVDLPNGGRGVIEGTLKVMAGGGLKGWVGFGYS